MVPAVGFWMPAINCINVVLPARVEPSSTLKVPSTSVSDVSWMWVSAPTFLLMTSSSSAMPVKDPVG